MNRSRTLLLCALIAVAPAAATAAEGTPAGRSLEELRNTVVNLLQGLVERGVITREQAQQMVQEAQRKATADAAAQARVDEEERTAVRVPYIPETVREEIRAQVAADLEQRVAKDVKEAAAAEGWGVPAALPDWARRVRLFADVRVRAQGDLFADDNLPNAYVDFAEVNDAGGIGRAGVDAFVNVTEQRERLRARLRFGLEANLGHGFTMGARLASGNLGDPVSTNQTLGQMGARYQTGIDLAWAAWSGNSATGRHVGEVQGGRIRNPFVTSDLVFDPDLAFEGIAGSYRLGLSRDDPYSRQVFLTAGGFPLQEFELVNDKWMLGGQLGVDWKFAGGSRARLAAGYYDFRNLAGRRNLFESDLLDYTAPANLQRGNTLFDIRNDVDPSTNLFALAGDYRVAEITGAFDWRVATDWKLNLAASYVRNLGFDAAKVLQRSSLVTDERTTGYQAEIGFGAANMARPNAWRAYAGYRYLERDAVLDAFTDSDFHLGGTDARGYFLGAEWAFSARVNARLRYMSSSEIDGPPLGTDVVQLDLNTSF